MNITIVGAGAIGSLWACKLHQAGHKVSVRTRHAHECEYVITLSDNSSKSASPITLNANRIDDIKQSDLILVTVKAWQVKQAVEPLLSDIHPDTILLFMHNGMGAVDELNELISGYPVVLGTTTQAAYKPEQCHVTHTGLGTTQLGAYNEAGKQCEFLTEVLNHALPEVSWNREIQNALWNKLAVNCAINPLTAIEQVTNGELADERFKAQLQTVVAEVTMVMNRIGMTCTKSALLELVYNVIKSTAKNHSSMQQDVFYRRKTEVDYITGHLCRTAQKLGIQVPANQALYQQIKQIEQDWTA